MDSAIDEWMKYMRKLLIEPHMEQEVWEENNRFIEILYSTIPKLNKKILKEIDKEVGLKSVKGRRLKLNIVGEKYA